MPQSLGLAVVLVAGVLVTFQNFFVYGAVLLAFAAAAVRPAAGSRLRPLVPIAVILAVSVALAAPFYVQQASRYGNPILALRGQSATTPFLDRRPAEFYTELRVRGLFTDPYRPEFANRLFPTAHAELWGDYFGYWNWSLPAEPTPAARAELVQQSAIGLLPSALGVIGWIALVVALVRGRLRRPEYVLFTATSLAALGAFLYYAIGHPSSDGDTIKASYMLVATPCWALAFAYAADRARRVPILGAAILFLLIGSALLTLPFLTYHDPLWGLL